MDQLPDVTEHLSNFVPAAFSVIRNAALTAVLYGLEYLVEKNGPCPCDPEWNATHSTLAFSVPTVVFFLISIMVLPVSWRMFKPGTCRRSPEGYQQLQSDNTSCDRWNICSQCCFVLNTLMQMLIPSIIWVIILLLDGDYVACYYAPSVNQTLGNQKCKEFCSLGVSSSLHEHCFWSREFGSGLLILSVLLLLFLKFIPRCACTKERYYTLKYKQALETKKWKTNDEELEKILEATANTEAKELIRSLNLNNTDQIELNSNQGEESSVQLSINADQAGSSESRA